MYRVLLIDDEPITKIAFRKLLAGNKRGFALTGTASNGVEALKYVEEHPADIIITDLKMPQMNGIELIHALKERNYDGSILVLSSYSDFELVREALLAGAQDYMLKVNLTADVLIEQLEKAAAHIDKMRKEVAQYDRMREQNESLRRVNIFKEFFLAPLSADTALPQEITGNFTGPQALWLFNILLWHHDGPKKERKIPLNGIADILHTIFGEAQMDCLTMQGNEFLCIVSAAPFLEKGVAREDKAKQIERQIQRYFDLRTTVIMPQAVTDIYAAHEKYQLCQSVRNICFYMGKHTLLYPETITFWDIPSEWSSTQTAVQIQEIFASSGQDGLASYLDSLFSQCEEIPVNPMSVRGFYYRVMQKMHSAADDIGDDEAILAAGNGILESTSVEELRRALLDLFPKLLGRTLPPAYGKYKKEVRQALLYVRFHYTEKITLDNVAKAVNLNASYLCRLVKKETAKSLFEHITALRMEKAAQMILQGNKYIKEVAACVGLEDQFYFTRLFKKYHGVAPSEYQAV